MAFLGGVVLGMTLLFVAALCAVVCIIKEL
jgi:hypothetical protein